MLGLELPSPMNRMIARLTPFLLAVLETYTYGASRERLMVETSNQRRYFAWGGQNVVAEYVETGSGTTPDYSKAYIYAGSRLFMTATKASSTTETKEFHHPDRLGTQLVTEGSTGSSFRQSTMPFGTAISTETTGNTNQVFTSYDRSSTTGLDYAQNRTYSKGQSRFTQVDPIAMASASRGNPQSNNLYAYVQNMPTDFVDPSGLQIVVMKKVCKPVYADYIINETGVTGGTYQLGWNCWEEVSHIINIGNGPTTGTPPNPVGGDPGGGGGGSGPAPCPETSTLFGAAIGAGNDGVGGAGKGMTTTGGSFGSNGRHYTSGWGGSGSVSTVNLTKLGGRLISVTGGINAAMAVGEVGYQGYQEGGVGPRTQRATGSAVGNILGSSGGAFVGSGVGFAVGGPPGAFIGGTIGSIGGGMLGSHVGNEVVHGIQDRNLPRGVRSCP